MKNLLTKPITTETRKRIESALAETRHSLKRAERFAFDLRDHGLIKFYNGHITKLENLLTI